MCVRNDGGQGNAGHKEESAPKHTAFMCVDPHNTKLCRILWKTVATLADCSELYKFVTDDPGNVSICGRKRD